MTASLLVIAALCASVGVTLVRGPLFALCWVYFPIVIAVPCFAELELPGLPEFSAARISIVGILAGSFLGGRQRELLPRWHLLDVLPMAMAVSFAISFGLRTEFMGFVNKFVKYGLDWAAPYVLVRALIRDRRSLLMLLGPGVLLVTVLGVVAVYEMRMAARPIERMWLGIGVPTQVIHFYDQWRLGMLRAHLHFGHPLTMGAFFTAMAPLVILRGVLVRKLRSHIAFAVVAGFGVAASLSRGPVAVLLFAAGAYWFARRSPKALVALAVMCVGIFAIPAWQMFEQLAEETQQGLDVDGNVESDYYRIALLILYGSRIADFGVWGRPELIAAEYAAAWSIDNSYLFQFIIGGMLGGGMFLVFTIGVLMLGFRRIMRTSGAARIFACCINASFVGLALALANVWFSDDVYILFWVTSALVVNLQMTRLLADDPSAGALLGQSGSALMASRPLCSREVRRRTVVDCQMPSLRTEPRDRLRARSERSDGLSDG